MSCAVILPVNGSATPDDLKASWAAFAVQSYRPRILVLANVGDGATAECLLLMAEIERFCARARQGNVFCMQATLPREALNLYPVGRLVDAEFLTIWTPGESHHRDTLGHLALELGSGLSGAVYCESAPKTFGVSMAAWDAIAEEAFLDASAARTAATGVVLWRRIVPVPGYSPAGVAG